MADCIFCMIANKEIPGNIVYEDDRIVCFHDASLDDVKDDDAELLGYIMTKVKDIAAILGLENGYRLVNNCGEDGMQTVKHLHFHLLGKRKLTWPPG